MQRAPAVFLLKQKEQLIITSRPTVVTSPRPTNCNGDDAQIEDLEFRFTRAGDGGRDPTFLLRFFFFFIFFFLPPIDHHRFTTRNRVEQKQRNKQVSLVAKNNSP